MPRLASGLVYVGIKGTVVALDRRDGMEVWRTPLKGSAARSSSFVCLYRDGDLLLATCGGEIYGLDAKAGSLLWRNQLKGLGLGFTSIAGDAASSSSNLAAIVAAAVQQQQAAAAAATG